MDMNLIEKARETATRNEKLYGQNKALYQRAALLATCKLNRNVTEFDIAVIQTAMVEAMLATTKADANLYAEMVRMMGICNEFAVATADNFTPINLTKVEGDLDENVKSIAKMFAPFTKKEGPSDDGPSAA